jgi:hypothetical protein
VATAGKDAYLELARPDMISRKNFDWPTLISDGERIGKKIEEEPDLARRQEEQRENEMDDRGR